MPLRIGRALGYMGAVPLKVCHSRAGSASASGKMTEFLTSFFYLKLYFFRAV